MTKRGAVRRLVLAATVLVGVAACGDDDVTARDQLLNCMDRRDVDDECRDLLIRVWVDNNDDETVTSALNEYNRCFTAVPREDCSEAWTTAVAAVRGADSPER